MIDSDNNGITDYNEDFDDDLLENGFEYSVGSNPLFPDSDFDGIDDKLEMNEYHTSPSNKDTDGDGGTDRWEINNSNFPPEIRA